MDIHVIVVAVWALEVPIDSWRTMAPLQLTVRRGRSRWAVSVVNSKSGGWRLAVGR